MNASDNPFEYEAANNIPPERILEFYIEDFNYSRFVQSTRNVFLVGERGCGKTMTLLYNGLTVQQLKAKREGKEISLSKLGIYVPCNTPLMHRQEHELLDPFKSALMSEHFLVLAIMHATADALSGIPNLLTPAEEEMLSQDFSYFLDIDLPTGAFFHSVARFAQREVIAAQMHINQAASDTFYAASLSFSSSVMPLFDCIKKGSRLRDSHFAIMLDDAQMLNNDQAKLINSWIAYRDHSQFSFKIATSKVDQPSYITTQGGSILEGHDFIELDMEQPFQYHSSPFGKHAAALVERRLQRISPDISPETFFPVSVDLMKDLERCREQARLLAKDKFGDTASSKQVNDYVYKYARAIYFRSRSSQANRPPYSGFETLVYLSTGVIRNLLEPCYWMYDKALSDLPEGNRTVLNIPTAIQTEIIEARSQRMWERLRDKLPNIIQNCSIEEAKRVYQLFDNLAILFRRRLYDPSQSEPRATSFTVSAWTDKLKDEILPLFNIARKANILYQRNGPAKDEGKTEVYYVPNRMLWPARGLDPVGQHARVSLQAKDIHAAAYRNIAFPVSNEISGDAPELPFISVEED